MRRIENSEAERTFENLLDEVELGGSIIITRGGKAIARLVPEADHISGSSDSAITAIRELRKQMPRLTVEEILSAVREGRRY